MDKIIFIDDEGCKDEINHFIHNYKDKIRLVVNENEFQGEMNEMVHKIKLVRKLSQEMDFESKQGKLSFKIIDILRFVSTPKGVMIFFQNQDQLLIHEDMDTLEKRLEGFQFIRINPDFLINIQHIKRIVIDNKQVVTSDDVKIHIDPGKLEKLMDYLDQWK